MTGVKVNRLSQLFCQKNCNRLCYIFSQSSSSSSLSAMKVGDLEMGEVDNLDEDLAKLDVGPRVMSAKIKSQHTGKPIDVKTAVVSPFSIILCELRKSNNKKSGVDCFQTCITEICNKKLHHFLS